MHIQMYVYRFKQKITENIETSNKRITFRYKSLIYVYTHVYKRTQANLSTKPWRNDPISE